MTFKQWVESLNLTFKPLSEIPEEWSVKDEHGEVLWLTIPQGVVFRYGKPGEHCCYELTGTLSAGSYVTTCCGCTQPWMAFIRDIKCDGFAVLSESKL